MNSIAWKSLFIAALICGASALLLFRWIDFSHEPAEDAAMLLRYAQNLAERGSIAFNPGMEMVDGATDFLTMVMVSGFQSAGMSGETALRMMCIIAHFLTVILVFFTVREVIRAPLWMAVLAAGSMALGPGLLYAQVLFAAPVFAFFAALSWTFTLMLLMQKPQVRMGWQFGLSLLLMSLVRPEGIILAAGMIALLWSRRGGPFLKGLQKHLLLAFVLPGLIYFVWHWIYFGYPLPNPFYVKGGGALHFDSLFTSFVAVAKLMLPFTPILLAAFIPIRGNKSALLLMPSCIFLLAWVLLSNEMNYLFRFQYPAIVILWMSWPLVLLHLSQHEKVKVATTRLGSLSALAALAFMGLAFAYQIFTFTRLPVPHADGRAQLGKDLERFRDGMYCMAVTEAGNLPYYSRWHCLDAWGLNDEEVAHAGQVSEEMIGRFSPDLIMIHGPLHAADLPTDRWGTMCKVMQDFAVKNNYVLAAAWGESKDDCHLYYVRMYRTAADTIVTLIRDRTYYSYVSGKPCKNFAPPLPENLNQR